MKQMDCLQNFDHYREINMKTVRQGKALLLWVLAGLLLFPAFSDAGKKEITLAVAPFKNIMKRPDLEWMGEGFAESITTKLNHIQTLRLVERVQLKEIINEMKLSMAGITEGDASSIGKLLSADFLIIGSFQKLDIGSTSKLKINVRVVRVETGEIEKGKALSLNGPYGNIFEMQSSVAAKLANSLGVSVSKEEMKRMANDETTSVVALELYHQARMETDDLRKEGLLKRALKYDPNYAKAHLLLGSYYRLRSISDAYFESPSIKHLQKAIQLDPSLTEAHFSLGDYYYRKQKAYKEEGDKQEADARKKAIYHFEAFIKNKKDSKAKYYIWKVKKAQKKLKKLKS